MRVELRDEAMRGGLSKSTFYKLIEKIVRSGEVKKTKHKLVPRIEEANRKELDDCLKTLTEEDNEQVISCRLKQLTKLSYDKRVAQFPSVIKKIAGLLDKSIIFDNQQNLNQFFECLTAILFIEQDHKGNRVERQRLPPEGVSYSKNFEATQSGDIKRLLPVRIGLDYAR